MRLGVDPTQSGLRVVARTYLQTCLQVIGTGTLKKIGKNRFFLPTRLTVNITARGW